MGTRDGGACSFTRKREISLRTESCGHTHPRPESWIRSLQAGGHGRGLSPRELRTWTVPRSREPRRLSRLCLVSGSPPHAPFPTARGPVSGGPPITELAATLRKIPRFLNLGVQDSHLVCPSLAKAGSLLQRRSSIPPWGPPHMCTHTPHAHAYTHVHISTHTAHTRNTRAHTEAHAPVTHRPAHPGQAPFLPASPPGSPLLHFILDLTGVRFPGNAPAPSGGKAASFFMA